MEKVLKRERGITLVALVVTIIILLILAGVAIRSVTGENGLFQRAKIARVEADISEVIDSAKMDIMTKQIEKVDGSITEGELKTILEKYGDLSEEGETSILDKKLTTDKGGHEIEVRRIYDGPFGGDEEGMVTCIVFGDTITFKKGMKWNIEFLMLPTGRKDFPTIESCFLNADIGYQLHIEDSGPIWCDVTAQYLTSHLYCSSSEMDEDEVVNWNDPVKPGAIYYWEDV